MPKDMRPRKVVIIGAGFVGSTFAYCLMISGLASEIVLIDVNRTRAEGEAMDLAHGVPFVRPVVIRSGDYDECEGADVIVITAGAAQKPGETRLDLVQRNADIFKDIIPKVTRHTTSSVLLIVTNPVDIMTYLAYKLSGYPPSMVIGSGTVLDTLRFRSLLSLHCNVSARNVHAYIIGEHGDSEVPVWSLANIAGMRLAEYCPLCERGCDPSWQRELFEEVRDAAYKVIERKGATYYAIGLAMTEITGSILRDENSVLTVSSLLDNYQGVSDVCLSVPALVGKQGVSKVVPLSLSQEEEKAFRKSAEIIRGIIDKVTI